MNVPSVRRRIQRELLTMLLDGPASVDRIDLSDIPSRQRRGVVGAAVADLRDGGLIASTETYELSTRPWAHRNPKRKWGSVDRGTTHDWLQRHPPLTPVPQRTLFDDL